MKILQVGKFYFPSPGGIETVVQTLSEGLVRLGDEVSVLCAAETAKRSLETINGVKVIREPYFGSLLSQPLTPTLPLSLRRLVREFDLVNFHSPNPLSEVLGLTMNRSTPSTTTYHADIVRQRLLKPFYRPLLRTFLKRQRRIFVPTRSHIEQSEFIRDLGEHCSVIPFGIEPHRLRATGALKDRAAELRGKYGKFILFVGRLVEYKGLKYAIEAMAKLQHTHADWKLIIVGDGPLKAELSALAVASGIADRVILTGHVSSGDEILSYYEACEVFLLPSITKAEAFGMVLLEAMSFAKPLLTTRICSGVSEVNADGVSGIQVAPADAEALTQALSRLASDKTLRDKLGVGAKQRFDSLYTADAMVRSYRAQYDEVVNGGRT